MGSVCVVTVEREDREARHQQYRREFEARTGESWEAYMARRRERSYQSAMVVQLAAIWLAVAGLLLVGLPSVVGDLVEERNTQEEVCIGSSTSVSEVLRMLVTRNLGDCEIGDKANTIRGMAWIFILAVFIGLILLTIRADEYLPVGADDVVGALGTAIVGLGVLAVMAVIALAYAMVLAAAYFVGLVVVIAASGSRK